MFPSRSSQFWRRASLQSWARLRSEERGGGHPVEWLGTLILIMALAFLLGRVGGSAAHRIGVGAHREDLARGAHVEDRTARVGNEAGTIHDRAEHDDADPVTSDACADGFLPGAYRAFIANRRGGQIFGDLIGVTDADLKHRLWDQPAHEALSELAVATVAAAPGAVASAPDLLGNAKDHFIGWIAGGGSAHDVLQLLVLDSVDTTRRMAIDGWQGTSVLIASARSGDCVAFGETLRSGVNNAPELALALADVVPLAVGGAKMAIRGARTARALTIAKAVTHALTSVTSASLAPKIAVAHRAMHAMLHAPALVARVETDDVTARVFERVHVARANGVRSGIADRVHHPSASVTHDVGDSVRQTVPVRQPQEDVGTRWGGAATTTATAIVGTTAVLRTLGLVPDVARIQRWVGRFPMVGEWWSAGRLRWRPGPFNPEIPSPPRHWEWSPSAWRGFARSWVNAVNDAEALASRHGWSARHKGQTYEFLDYADLRGADNKAISFDRYILRNQHRLFRQRAGWTEILGHGSGVSLSEGNAIWLARDLALELKRTGYAGGPAVLLSCSQGRDFAQWFANELGHVVVALDEDIGINDASLYASAFARWRVYEPVTWQQYTPRIARPPTLEPIPKAVPRISGGGGGHAVPDVSHESILKHMPLEFRQGFERVQPLIPSPEQSGLSAGEHFYWTMRLADSLDEARVRALSSKGYTFEFWRSRAAIVSPETPPAVEVRDGVVRIDTVSLRRLDANDQVDLIQDTLDDQLGRAANEL